MTQPSASTGDVWGLRLGLTYTGFGNVFLAVPDRGPFDGRTDVPYLDRFHFLHIKVDPKRSFPNIRHCAP